MSCRITPALGLFAAGLLTPAIAAEPIIAFVNAPPVAGLPAASAPVPVPPGYAPVAVRPVPAPQAPLYAPIPSPVYPTAHNGVPLVDDCAAEAECGCITGGASLYLLEPHFQTNTAFTAVSPVGSPDAVVTGVPFDYDYQPGAAFFLGFRTPGGFGANARYFHFEQNANTLRLDNRLGQSVSLPLGPVAFSPGTALGSAGAGLDFLTFDSDLKVYNLDVEGTYTYRDERVSLVASAGGRYQHLEQGYRATLVNGGGGLPIAEAQSALANRRFIGGGPVVGLLGHLRVGDSGLSVFTNLRAALLVGETIERGEFDLLVSDPTGLVPAGTPVAARPRSTRSGDNTLPVTELELGMQYGLDLGSTSAFFRGAVVNHTYFDAGSASQSTGSLSLFGVQMTAGLSF